MIVDKKIEGREDHLKDLRRLVKHVREFDQAGGRQIRRVAGRRDKAKRDKLARNFRKLDKKLQDSFPKFYYKQKVIEEMALVAENIHDKIQLEPARD